MEPVVQFQRSFPTGFTSMSCSNGPPAKRIRRAGCLQEPRQDGSPSIRSSEPRSGDALPARPAFWSREYNSLVHFRALIERCQLRAGHMTAPDRSVIIEPNLFADRSGPHLNFACAENGRRLRTSPLQSNRGAPTKHGNHRAAAIHELDRGAFEDMVDRRGKRWRAFPIEPSKKYGAGNDT